MELEERRRDKWRLEHPGKYGPRKKPVNLVKHTRIPRAAIRKLTYNATLTDEQWEKRQSPPNRREQDVARYEALKASREAETPEEREKRLAILRARAARLVWAETFTKKNAYHVTNALCEVIPAIVMNIRTKYDLGDDPSLVASDYVRNRKYEEVSRPHRVGKVFKGSFKKVKDVKKQIQTVRAVLEL
jgi:hypothetical protein